MEIVWVAGRFDAAIPLRYLARRGCLVDSALQKPISLGLQAVTHEQATLESGELELIAGSMRTCAQEFFVW